MARVVLCSLSGIAAAGRWLSPNKRVFRSRYRSSLVVIEDMGFELSVRMGLYKLLTLFQAGRKFGAALSKLLGP